MDPGRGRHVDANIILGTSGVLLLVVRNRFGDLGNGIAIPIPRFRRRAAAAPPGSPAGQAGSQAVARQAAARPPVVVLRVPQLNLPTRLDIYMAKHYDRSFLLAFAGMLGIFYIATFIDLSDKLFKGQATTSMLLEYFYYSTPQ